MDQMKAERDAAQARVVELEELVVELKKTLEILKEMTRSEYKDGKEASPYEIHALARDAVDSIDGSTILESKRRAEIAKAAEAETAAEDEQTAAFVAKNAFSRADIDADRSGFDQAHERWCRAKSAFADATEARRKVVHEKE